MCTKNLKICHSQNMLTYKFLSKKTVTNSVIMYVTRGYKSRMSAKNFKGIEFARSPCIFTYVGSYPPISLTGSLSVSHLVKKVVTIGPPPSPPNAGLQMGFYFTTAFLYSVNKLKRIELQCHLSLYNQTHRESGHS